MATRKQHDKMILVRIVAPHFVAGMLVKGGVVVEAAPILRWTVGKSLESLRDCDRRGWTLEILS